MDEIQMQIFSTIVSRVETPLINAVAQVTNAFLTFVGPSLKVALVLYIALTGILIIRGQASEVGSVIMGRFLKMGLVVWVLTGSGVYQQYVYDFFFTTLPQGLAQALTATGTAGVVRASSFDQAWLQAWDAGLTVWKTLGWRQIGESFVIIVYWLAAIISTVVAFIIWLTSRVLLALYIALGPLLIGLALFPATRSIFERWIGSLISCVILQITTVVLLYIVLSVEQQVVGTIAQMGSVDSMVMIQVLLAGVIFFGVAAFIALQLPGVATSLSGGLHFHASSLIRGASQSLQTAGRGAVATARGVAGAGRHIAAGGRAVYQRIRPPVGGSLSDMAR
ncbi:TrbL/VirB6 family protein [Siccirubricoccus phaeus]|uniref:type IV secretion system protein n=1 Tax=Siccirubricoccus phaeus TaxID=2595053 RepID=UPI0011F16EF7|nr:type IV secretion system protein [Siccirubricoccus phaeus]